VNAGLLAVRILSVGLPELVEKMEAYMREMEGEVLQKVEKLEEVGWEKYELKK
jgi:phosphoribosylaminoimidazole carboxylase